MKSLCKSLFVCLAAVFMLLAISPSQAEAGKWRRYRAVHVVQASPVVEVATVHVAPVRVHAPVRTYVAPATVIYRGYRPAVHVVSPGVRVHVRGYSGVSIGVGGWGW
jgi:hypothetical protein